METLKVSTAELGATDLRIVSAECSNSSSRFLWFRGLPNHNRVKLQRNPAWEAGYGLPSRSFITPIN